MSQQNLDGSFNDKHPVLHKKAMGGVEGSIPLTAYMLIVFHQCRPYFSKLHSSKLNKTISRAEEFVLANYTETLGEKEHSGEPYRQALVAYALSFFDKPQAAKLRQSLTERLADSSTVNQKLNQQYWKGVDWPIETAAYALLAFIAPSKEELTPVDVLNYVSIANWLNKRQKKGAFDNTQDTIVALDALSKYYALYKLKMEDEEDENSKEKGYTLQIDLHFDEQLKKTINFSKTSVDLLQTLAVDDQTQEINIKTTGNGLILNLKIITSY